MEQARQHNLDTFLRQGAGLSSNYTVWIEAKDSARKRVLLGGLGGMGVGQMWAEEENCHKKYLGYNEAPQSDSYGQFGTSESRAI